jgi:hypothetical protein
VAKKSVSAKRGPLKLTRLPAYRALATGVCRLDQLSATSGGRQGRPHPRKSRFGRESERGAHSIMGL